MQRASAATLESVRVHEAQWLRATAPLYAKEFGVAMSFDMHRSFAIPCFNGEHVARPTIGRF